MLAHPLSWAFLVIIITHRHLSSVCRSPFAHFTQTSPINKKAWRQSEEGKGKGQVCFFCFCCETIKTKGSVYWTRHASRIASEMKELAYYLSWHIVIL